MLPCYLSSHFQFSLNRPCLSIYQCRCLNFVFLETERTEYNSERSLRIECFSPNLKGCKFFHEFSMFIFSLFLFPCPFFPFLLFLFPNVPSFHETGVNIFRGVFVRIASSANVVRRMARLTPAGARRRSAAAIDVVSTAQFDMRVVGNKKS